MPLTFNIIYTPGTISLAFLATSLMRWSDCAWRLVANHCTPHEQQYLQHLTQRAARCEYYALPDTGRVWPHADALGHLQELTTEDKFCFLDSDIFAVGPFVAHFRQNWDTYAGVFAGAPVWCQPAEQIWPTGGPLMAGEYHRTAEGFCLGGTYCAIYDNRRLREFRRTHGFAFEARTWATLDAMQQATLTAAGLRAEFYDTGKLLNIWLQNEGARLLFSETDALCHLGGISYVPLKQRQARVYGQQRRAALGRRPWQIAPVVVRRLRRAWQRWRQPVRFDQSGKLPFSVRRDSYSFYFAAVLAALHEHAPLPAAPRAGVPEIAARVAVATQQVTEIHRTFEQLMPDVSPIGQTFT